MKNEPEHINLLAPPHATAPGADNTTFASITAYSILFAWMFIIWQFSDQPNSAEATREVFGTANYFVRKVAHFSEYAILAALTWRALRSHGDNPAGRVIRHFAGANSYRTAMVVAVLYAISDEIHQAFVPGRSAAIHDVLVDSAGAITMIMTIRWWHSRRK